LDELEFLRRGHGSRGNVAEPVRAEQIAWSAAMQKRKPDAQLRVRL
jgi:hypothetical protein